LIRLGCTIPDWKWVRGWDEEFGGLFYFRDLCGLPVEEYLHDMKFWWPHNEAIIATLLAHQFTAARSTPAGINSFTTGALNTSSIRILLNGMATCTATDGIRRVRKARCTSGLSTYHECCGIALVMHHLELRSMLHHFGDDWHVVRPDQIRNVLNLTDPSETPANTHRLACEKCAVNCAVGGWKDSS